MKTEEKLSQLRKERGMTQTELAEALDVSRQTVSKWECGVAVPTTDKLICIGKIFGVPLDDLLNDDLSVQRAPVETVMVAEKEPEPPAPPKRRWARLAAGVGLAVCLLLITVAAVITICSAIFKEPEKPENGTIRLEDLEPDYIDLDEVIDRTEGRMVIP